MMARPLLAAALAFSLAACPLSAFAETNDTEADAVGLQKSVESTAAEYNRATEEVEALKRQIEENEAEIASIDSKISTQREVCSGSMVDLYKMHRSDAGLVTVILASEDLSTFLSAFDYFNRIHESSSDNLQSLTDMLRERNETQESLDQAKADAEQEQERAERASLLAIAQREAAQKAAQEQAALEEKQRQEAAAAEKADSANGNEQSSSSSSLATPSQDGANWNQDKTSFVSSWAGRLDGYLAGSPLSGQGSTFASAAWDAGIDPRFSAAISTVESSKGAACSRPFNAWGWGSSSWGSWEEAIPAHATGLARGYGYTVSEAGAKKYCPGNWEHWYNRVSEEMGKI